ncbi:uncharacterized protein BO72DRAFT_270150 [Aspergillus fijiensis CBS 313.89]|uniref:Uncharacterized protein n=1 Tax=Aspergillus fijiensis CBS 313.89 TaxID=1448319 RepID=A0A8G1RLA8_9EURO|nr:uncharacterized protein BO72DRAFT_270150 [Aspergillus fijiensis CBS 313.89]RAK72561.1 hypothetical protein BO72DRAFT_270150 [Aspergillus fijiensis CBS 313.89]
MACASSCDFPPLSPLLPPHRRLPPSPFSQSKAYFLITPFSCPSLSSPYHQLITPVVFAWWWWFCFVPFLVTTCTVHAHVTSSPPLTLHISYYSITTTGSGFLSLSLTSSPPTWDNSPGFLWFLVDFS